MTFFIRIAGKTVKINSLYERVQLRSIPYMVDEQSPDFTVDITEADILTERGQNQITDSSYMEELAVYRKIAEKMLDYNTFLMHGSVIGVNDSAYMITAASGVGKTTRTNTWLRCIAGSYIINGDKPLIRITEDQAIACGTPWCGKESQSTNTMVPLKAILFLERAEENKVTEISFQEALSKLLQQTYRPKDTAEMIKTMNLLKLLKGRVKFYRFQSNREDEAVIKAYQITSGQAQS